MWAVMQDPGCYSAFRQANLHIQIREKLFPCLLGALDSRGLQVIRHNNESKLASRVKAEHVL